jgi:hypothetical protein
MARQSPEALHYRAIVASRSRNRAPDDPELLEARERYATAAWTDRVKRLIDAAPPLSREDLEPIAALLNARVIE